LGIVVAEFLQAVLPVAQPTASKVKDEKLVEIVNYAHFPSVLPAVKRSAQVQYNYSTTAIQEFFSCIAVVLHLCAPCNKMLQYKFSTTCRKLAGYLQQ